MSERLDGSYLLDYSFVTVDAALRTEMGLVTLLVVANLLAFYFGHDYGHR